MEPGLKSFLAQGDGFFIGATNYTSSIHGEQNHNASSYNAYGIGSNYWTKNNNDLKYNYYPKQTNIHGIGYGFFGTWKQPSVVHDIACYNHVGTWYNSSKQNNIVHGSSFVIKAGNIQDITDNGHGIYGTSFAYGGDIELIPGVARTGGTVAESFTHRSGSVRMFVRGRGHSSNYTADDPEMKREVFTMDYRGWLALGKYGADADAPLEVMHTGSITSHNGPQYAWWVVNGVMWDIHSTELLKNLTMATIVIVTARIEHGLAAEFVLTRSDERMKTDIKLVDDRKALEIINKIESYEYHYKDPKKRNKLPTIGFLAQQVQQHLPNCISHETNFIPDELRELKDLQWNESTLTINDLIWNESDTGTIKFIVWDDDPKIDEDEYKNNDVELKINCIIDEDGKKTNKFSFDKKWDHVILHGKEISDFHIIDKNQIYALHHSAIQELSRENVLLKDKIAVLEEKMKDVMTVMLKLDL